MTSRRMCWRIPPCRGGCWCCRTDACGIGWALLFAKRECHFGIPHKPRTARDAVTRPYGQENRYADIRCRRAHPVDAVLQEGFVVLPQGDQQAQGKRKYRPEREERRYVRQIGQPAALGNVSAPEPVVADGDAQPR